MERLVTSKQEQEEQEEAVQVTKDDRRQKAVARFSDRLNFSPSFAKYLLSCISSD
jgi:hypothetical protein